MHLPGWLEMGGWNASSLWTGPKEKTKTPFLFIKSFPMLKLLINLA